MLYYDITQYHMENEQKLKELKWQMEDIKEQMRVLAGENGEEAKETAKQYVDKVSTSIKSYLDDSTSTVKNKAAMATEATRAAGAKADGYAHENPWQIAAIGAAVGLALGALLSRKND